MERLSNIMRTGQQARNAAHKRLSPQFPQQGQRQPAPAHRPLPENRAPGLYSRPTPSRASETKNGTWEEPDSRPSRPAGRPTYSSQRVARPPQTLRYSEQPPQGDYYEEGSGASPVNSQEDWSDDTAGMVYGDWESVPAYPRTPHYQTEDDYALPVSRPRETNPAPRVPTQDLSPVAQRLAQLHGKGGPLATRELYRVTPETTRPAPVRETRLPVPAANSQLTPAAQNPHVTQRNTQPLKPQQMARFQADMQQRALRTQQAVLPDTSRSAGADYTIMVNSASSVCQHCHGAGYLRSNVPFGHPQFGKAVACQCKEQERKRKRRQQLQEISNLGAFANKRFETFNQRIPGLQEAFHVSEEFSKGPDGWLLLVGPNGCGKTHLAAAIANECLEAGAVVLFATVPDLLDHLRAAFAPNANEIYDQLFGRMREAEVLVLDDLGTQQSSPWASEKLFQLLNYRYNSGFPTVITANPKGLQATDERIRSRLSDISLVTTVNLERARDYRPSNPRRD